MGKVEFWKGRCGSGHLGGYLLGGCRNKHGVEEIEDRKALLKEFSG